MLLGEDRAGEGGDAPDHVGDVGGAQGEGLGAPEPQQLPGQVATAARRVRDKAVRIAARLFEVAPEDLPSELIGRNVRITIPVSSTGGAVLAVPAAALSATAAGRPIVQVERPDGSLRTVEVAAGLATGGPVEVTPLDGRLEEGDLVVVGREDGSPLELDEIGTDPDARLDDGREDGEVEEADGDAPDRETDE